MNYYLVHKDYYLSDINYSFDEKGYVIIHDFLVGKELQKTFWMFEVANEIKEKIFEETGLDFTVKKFKKEEE